MPERIKKREEFGYLSKTASSYSLQLDIIGKKFYSLIKSTLTFK
jgi:hypothetical protein